MGTKVGDLCVFRHWANVLPLHISLAHRLVAPCVCVHLWILAYALIQAQNICVTALGLVRMELKNEDLVKEEI